MKSKITRVTGLLFTLAFLLTLPMSVNAASLSQLQLTSNSSKVSVGQELIIDVLVKNAPAIYGADVRLAFDPRLVEVVDGDKGISGIQVKQGNFINPNKSYYLLNKVDNVAGTIGYALTLLNPAPVVSGNGQLAQITFKAKAAGQATISITQGAFGTKTGEKVIPQITSAKIKIVIKDKGGIVSAAQDIAAVSQPDQTNNLQENAIASTNPPISNGILYFGLGGLGLGLIGVMLAFISIKHIKSHPGQRN